MLVGGGTRNASSGSKRSTMVLEYPMQTQSIGDPQREGNEEHQQFNNSNNPFYRNTEELPRFDEAFRHQRQALGVAPGAYSRTQTPDTTSLCSTIIEVEDGQLLCLCPCGREFLNSISFLCVQIQ
ncbi:hypothetical protein PoB_005731200 [Plakobranchus ocellatus]|uniref:Uncharacterized protein n=1 Tax=Plakobranchus ocellatus TaxID=259542 RepID=A0AAV4CGU9_9GAST|nr:hypothetical protein PoB_005731200 [Plakobranchus ocellatus]